jgi:diaminohydroxyphosphoribosylaminopyrimidine deaminase/5-amino-6-(5-phosphoribosylamino)uracil reductase
LTARPDPPSTVARIATRVVVDSAASLSPESQLVRTAREVPVLVAVSETVDAARQSRLKQAGCEVLVCNGSDHAARLESLLVELGRQRLTNVLVEGGSGLLGNLFDAGQIDEVHAFIAPKLIGGGQSPSPIGGAGLANMASAWELDEPVIETIGPDVYVHGVVRH